MFYINELLGKFRRVLGERFRGHLVWVNLWKLAKGKSNVLV